MRQHVEEHVVLSGECGAGRHAGGKAIRYLQMLANETALLTIRGSERDVGCARVAPAVIHVGPAWIDRKAAHVVGIGALVDGNRLPATVEVAGKVLADQSLIERIVGRADKVALASSAQHHPVKRRRVKEELINGCRHLRVAARKEVIDADDAAASIARRRPSHDEQGLRARRTAKSRAGVAGGPV
jgi:hypothetical protein